ncbi:MAG: ribosome small subunit-dependent GTPase A [Betaproteobacteria bacterium]|nr:ribosome small subunit-dependent GTPase A [Betaproteobacteria bacterium]
MLAEILASHGRQYWIRALGDAKAFHDADAAIENTVALTRPPFKQRLAVTRGRRQDFCVGDRVDVEAIGDDQAVINALIPRRNLLQRSDHFRHKLLAANIDQIGLVLAAEPPFSESLAVRVSVAAAVAGIPMRWLINKSDRIEALADIEPRLELYRALGVGICYLSARHDAQSRLHEGELGQWLQGKTSLLLGQSGMGKSTLINRLVPDADLKTQQWSRALQSGKHTTSFSKCFDLPESDFEPGSRIIDSPGFQQFGHFKHRHILKRIVLSAVFSFFALALLAWVMNQAWFYRGLGLIPLPGSQASAALLLFSLVIPVFLFPIQPLMSWWSRKHEFEADAYAASQTQAADLESALIKLIKDNAATLTPDPIHSAIYDSHPPASIRIARLQALSERLGSAVGLANGKTPQAASTR